MTYNNSTIVFLLTILLSIFILHPMSSSGQQQPVKAAYWFQGSGFPLTSIDSSLFTHLFYAFADLNTTTYQLTISPSNLNSFSQFTKTVQQRNPNIKTLISIGGGDSTLASGFISMASSPASRKSFIDSSIKLARNYNFHGLDLDYEYPKVSSDMTNLGILLNEWRSAVNLEATSSGKPPLILTAAVYYSATRSNSLNYPYQSMAKNLDWINVMAYDFWAPKWSDVTRPNAALYDPTSKVNGDNGVKSWIKAGLPTKKIVLGFPFYGYEWSLVDVNKHGYFAPFDVGLSKGATVFSKIKEFVDQEKAITVYNSTVVENYCYSGNTWICYDDVDSITVKVRYVKENGLLGYFAWHAGADDNWMLSKAAASAML